MINRVVLVGRLTRDPELRQTTSGKSVVDFGVDVDKRTRQGDAPAADSFRVTSWERTAEFVANNVPKGSLVVLDGRLTSNKFVGNDGASREVIEVVAEGVQCLTQTETTTGASVNRIVLVGRLVRDPELRHTAGGKSVVDFSIAVDKRIRPTDGSPTADFFRITAWEKTAEFVANYLTKGRLVGIEGRLQSRSYTASDGTNREVVEVTADTVQGLDRARDDAGGGESRAAVAPAPARVAAAPAPVPDEDEFDPFADE